MQTLKSTAVFQTDQVRCFDAAGDLIPCSGSGQDGAARCGAKWPEPRFVEKEGTVQDRLTGLMWPKNASLDDFSMTWQGAMEQIEAMNRANALGYRESGSWKASWTWRAHSPALTAPYPFSNVKECYWSSTTSAYDPAYAW